MGSSLCLASLPSLVLAPDHASGTQSSPDTGALSEKGPRVSSRSTEFVGLMARRP